MDKNQVNTRDADSINLMHLAKALWKRALLILLITVIVGAATFAYTKLFIKPKYSSYVEFYVNTDTISGLQGITAGRDLVDTYIVILNTRDTLKEVKLKANVPDSESQIAGMLSAASRNGTEVFRVTVTSDSAEKSQKIAKAIETEFPVRIRALMDGHSPEVVQKAELYTSPVSPSVVKNTAIGLGVGFLIACMLFVILALLDDTIHDEDYITENYNLPILAKIPNLAFESRADYYYKKNSKYKYKYSATADYGKAIANANKPESEETK